MAIAGTLLDASNLEPVKGVLVGLCQFSRFGIYNVAFRPCRPYWIAVDSFPFVESLLANIVFML